MISIWVVVYVTYLTWDALMQHHVKTDNRCSKTSRIVDKYACTP